MREENLARQTYFQTDLSDPYFLSLQPMFVVLEAVSKYATGNLLDIGCGNKPYKKLFASAEKYVGCDIAQSSERSVDVICDATNIALQSETFETVFSTQTIEHVEEPKLLCGEAFRLLKSNGYFIVSGPMYWHLHEEPFDFFRFTKHGFRHLLETVGFEVVEIHSNGGKWAMLGLVLIHTLQDKLLKRRRILRQVNRLFAYLDKKYFNDFNTSNYVAVARKP